MSGWNLILTLVILAIIVIVVLARLYRKASREVSLIRTGLGGQKVIMAGGAIALPYFHEVAEVNMRSVRLEVLRNGEDEFFRLSAGTTVPRIWGLEFTYSFSGNR